MLEEVYVDYEISTSGYQVVMLIGVHTRTVVSYYEDILLAYQDMLRINMSLGWDKNDNFL